VSDWKEGDGGSSGGVAAGFGERGWKRIVVTGLRVDEEGRDDGRKSVDDGGSMGGGGRREGRLHLESTARVSIVTNGILGIPERPEIRCWRETRSKKANPDRGSDLSSSREEPLDSLFWLSSTIHPTKQPTRTTAPEDREGKSVKLPIWREGKKKEGKGAHTESARCKRSDPPSPRVFYRSVLDDPEVESLVHERQKIRKRYQRRNERCGSSQGESLLSWEEGRRR